ncbi:transcriptional regulator [Sporanaerobium hydrogeniformans]|uniref:Transcriptional regulator n=1 Tax=Sporanaerobium hydrogeniformans TaxID=3072179 RepID=A0AC61DF81_9FIRM|nr:Lrp/AsnC family transcriptional regulator [Sporanaerobium hydrogeniformans]PHV71227.1 transcriptional regulator [Sporanaerobium hydrogeniformans]
MLDNVDFKIIEILQEDARTSLKMIGEKVHLTPQAVSNRINRLYHLGVITHFTITTNEKLLGRSLLFYVNIIMTTSDHQAFIHFIQHQPVVRECYRTTGHSCYLAKICCADMEEVNTFLEELLHYANYSLNASTLRIK